MNHADQHRAPPRQAVMLIIVRQSKTVGVRFVMKMEMNVRLSVMGVCVNVNIRTIAKNYVEDACSQKDDHQRNQQFEKVCHLFGNRNANRNYEETCDK